LPVALVLISIKRMFMYKQCGRSVVECGLLFKYFYSILLQLQCICI
jgi:hypothetical protein